MKQRRNTKARPPPLFFELRPLLLAFYEGGESARERQYYWFFCRIVCCSISRLILSLYQGFTKHFYRSDTELPLFVLARSHLGGASDGFVAFFLSERAATLNLPERSSGAIEPACRGVALRLACAFVVKLPHLLSTNHAGSSSGALGPCRVLQRRASLSVRVRTS